MRRALIAVVGVLLVAVLASGCTQTARSGPAAKDRGAERAQETDVVVSLTRMAFAPRELRVPAGTRVLFRNDDTIEHNVVHGKANSPREARPLFASPPLQPGQAWGHVFREPGVFPVKCTSSGHHLLGMVATVIVE